ncbi:MAG: type II toxin-antitoxin system VapC family toxin [Nanoarchaeota archaeon]
MILDTSFIIDVMNKKAEAIKKIRELEENKKTYLVTSLTIFELFSGVGQSKKPDEEKTKIKEVLGSGYILPLDEDSAREGGFIHGQLRKEGTPIGTADCMIAGITLINNEKLLTNNVKDFKKIKGLELVTY